MAALTRALRATLLAHPNTVPLLGTRPPVSPGGFRGIEAAVTVLLDAGFSPQDEQHRQAQRDLPRAEFPGLDAITREGVTHSPGRLFDVALRGLLLVLADRLRPGPTA